MTTPPPPTVTQQFAALLGELGLGEYRAAATGGDVFLFGLPRDPAAAVAVTLVGGPEADGRHGYDEPTVLYRVRGAPGDPAGAERRAQAIWDALHGLRKRTLSGGTRLVRCFAAQAGPVFVGVDDQGRAEWSITMSTELRRPTFNRR